MGRATRSARARAGHPPGVALLYTDGSWRWWRERIVYSRATPGGWPVSRSPWLQVTLLGPPLAAGLVQLRARQATRQGWPYYIRTARGAGGGSVSYIVGPPLAGGLPGLSTTHSRPATTQASRPGRPPGQATRQGWPYYIRTARGAGGGSVSYIVGPPLAGGLVWPEVNACGATSGGWPGAVTRPMPCPGTTRRPARYLQQHF